MDTRGRCYNRGVNCGKNRPFQPGLKSEGKVRSLPYKWPPEKCPLSY
jgi:hypothetical protein